MCIRDRRKPIKKQLIAAFRIAGFDIPRMDDESRVLLGDLLQHDRQFAALVVAVGRIADDGKAPGFSLYGKGHEQTEMCIRDSSR